MTRSAAPAADPIEASPLLGPGDPAPYEVVNPDARTPILLICDHASRVVPAALDNLGLSQEKFDLHIAYDIGAAEVTRRLARKLGAPAVLGGYSRLVVDCNRAPGEPTMMPETSDEIAVPGNQGLGAADVMARLGAIFWPYHGKISEMLARLRLSGPPPILFSIHSFTPSLGGVERYWDIGTLWNRDPRLATPLIEGLRTHAELNVGDNEPYSGRDLAYTLDVHGAAAGLANCAVEIRQDNLVGDAAVQRWADILADALAPILADGRANAVERF